MEYYINDEEVCALFNINKDWIDDLHIYKKF